MKRAKLVVVLVLVAIVAVIVFQNTASIETRILWYSITMPLAVLIFITSMVGFAAGVLACLGASKKLP